MRLAPDRPKISCASADFSAPSCIRENRSARSAMTSDWARNVPSALVVSMPRRRNASEALPEPLCASCRLRLSRCRLDVSSPCETPLRLAACVSRPKSSTVVPVRCASLDISSAALATERTMLTAKAAAAPAAAADTNATRRATTPATSPKLRMRPCVRSSALSRPRVSPSMLTDNAPILAIQGLVKLLDILLPQAARVVPLRVAWALVLVPPPPL